MDEKSNIELLRDFARVTNRTIVAKEILYPITGIRKFVKYRRLVYMPFDSNKNSFFIWFSDPYARIGLPTVFCGVVIPISSRIDSKFRIRKKNIVDKLNIFPKKKDNLIGKEYLDSKVIISGSVDTAAKRLLSQPRIQDQLLKALEISPVINISINEFNLDFVPELKNNSYLGIVNLQEWLFDRYEIENLFKQIEKIKNALN